MTATEGTGNAVSQPAQTNGLTYGKATAPAADPTGKAIPVVEFLLGNEYYAVSVTDYIICRFVSAE